LRICAAAYTGFSEVLVKDPELAKKLQAWYPTWCKRPAFSAADEYLDTFNRANVTLVDTDRKGLSGMTATSIVAGKQSFHSLGPRTNMAHDGPKEWNTKWTDGCFALFVLADVSNKVRPSRTSKNTK
jgi:hypothetical protein